MLLGNEGGRPTKSLPLKGLTDQTKSKGSPLTCLNLLHVQPHCPHTLNKASVVPDLTGCVRLQCDAAVQPQDISPGCPSFPITWTALGAGTPAYELDMVSFSYLLLKGHLPWTDSLCYNSHAVNASLLKSFMYTVMSYEYGTSQGKNKFLYCRKPQTLLDILLKGVGYPTGTRRGF